MKIMDKIKRRELKNLGNCQQDIKLKEFNPKLRNQEIPLHYLHCYFIVLNVPTLNFMI